MAFFDNFSKKVQDVVFVATEKAQQVAAVAGEKANAVADKAKTEYEMASERRSMDKNYRAIGEWYVSTLEGDAPEAVADIVPRSLPKPRRPRRTKSFPMCGAALAAPLFSSLG